ncbi:MAG: FAD-dependent oxidoreductase [Coriobacteriia bacterium]
MKMATKDALSIDANDHTYMPRNDELPTPKVPAPKVTDYTSDVLVIGGGLAGLNAAWAARQAGKSVVLVDKGTPGYAGMSAWPSCTAYYDPELDADEATWRSFMRMNSQNMADLDWEWIWATESKRIFKRLQEWGWIKKYDNGETLEGGKYYKDGLVFHDDCRGYFKAVDDRRKVFGKVLDENKVTVVDHVMVCDLVEDAGRVVGAVGLHYRSATPIKFAAKAVIMCTGTGCVKPTGFPVGADTFDGIWMGYQHGLPITGMEFEDFHQTCSYAPGNVLGNIHWQYMENVWPTGGTVAGPVPVFKEYIFGGRENAWIKGFFRSDTTSVEKAPNASCSVAFKKGNTSDPRAGKITSATPVGDTYGAAVGMPMHDMAGIWCGVDDKVGATSIPGLYVAGDGTNGCAMSGPNYGHERGSMSSFVSLCGERAGNAACQYIDEKKLSDAALPADKVKAISDKALAPLSLERGREPNWVRDILHGFMAPGWITVAKDEAGLTNALDNVVRLRNLASGKMIAENGHDLRLCMEVEHQLLAMELKLRAGIARKESRGVHYRTDHPYKDDNYLYFITWSKGADGQPVMGKADLKDDWKGDLSAPYRKRYPILTTPEEFNKYGTEEEKKNSEKYNR